MKVETNWDRVTFLVTTLRLTVGYCASKGEPIPVDDLNGMYEDLCEVSELLSIGPLVIGEEEAT